MSEQSGKRFRVFVSHIVDSLAIAVHTSPEHLSVVVFILIPHHLVFHASEVEIIHQYEVCVSEILLHRLACQQ